MITKKTEDGGWYGDCNLDMDNVSLHPNSHLMINGNRIELPVNAQGQKENVLFTVLKRWNFDILIAGQGQVGDKGSGNWLYKGGKWNLVSGSFGVYPCAFSDSSLYLIVGPNQYVVYDLASDSKTEPISRAVGSQGIRYIDFSQSVDGIVTGDETYGPGIYNLSQWIRRFDTVLGQSYTGGAVALVNKIRRVIEPGDCQFLRFYEKDNKIAITIVKQVEKKTIFLWMESSDLLTFPLDTIIIIPPEKLMQAPNKIDVVQRMIKAHPEVNPTDKVNRGKLLDYFIHEMNGKPWGRKARNVDGSNKNTDALMYLFEDGTIEIIDVLGGDGSASWNTDGRHWHNGENGFWSPGESVTDVVIIKDPPTDNTDLENLKHRVVTLESLILNVLKYGDRIGLKTVEGFFVCAESSGALQEAVETSVIKPGNVNATRTGLGEWETFIVSKP